MDDVNNANQGPKDNDVGQTSSQPVITRAIGNPQFNYQSPEGQTPNNNVPLNLAQLSQFSPEQLQTIVSFIQMLTASPQQSTPNQPAGGTRKRPLAVGGRNADGTPLQKMRSLNPSGRELEKRIDQSDYEEDILETEELYHSEEEAQGGSRREYSASGASNYSTGGHLLIKPKVSPFTMDLLNHPMTRIKMPTSKYDGTSDPDDHESAYEGHMFLYTDVDAIWCKVFPSTLTGIAQSWFKSLKPGSTSSFSRLSSTFNTHFVSN
ncbi:hypothetical protein BVRB_9g209650 [Beta vulgaris subsp. vulgaris]|nr:hypothetical protein BVRB_9g209650 [Beta vulgaris subsp. vulgaris]